MTYFEVKVLKNNIIFCQFSPPLIFMKYAAATF